MKFWTKLRATRQKKVLRFDSPARSSETTASEGRRSRWPCQEEAPYLDNKHTSHKSTQVSFLSPCLHLDSVESNRYRPGSEKTALEWQASSSSRMRLNTDPCSVHHTLSERRRAQNTKKTSRDPPQLLYLSITTYFDDRFLIFWVVI